jgi:hypothetical protein
MEGKVKSALALFCVYHIQTLRSPMISLPGLWTDWISAESNLIGPDHTLTAHQAQSMIGFNDHDLVYSTFFFGRVGFAASKKAQKNNDSLRQGDAALPIVNEDHNQRSGATHKITLRLPVLGSCLQQID